MVDLTKPCVNCGLVDRSSDGKCKPCQKKYQKKYRESEENREKSKAYSRKYRKSENGIKSLRKYEQSKKGRESRRAAKLRYNQDTTRPCTKCGGVSRYKGGNCKDCSARYQQAYRQTAKGRESKRKYMLKYFAVAENRERKKANIRKHRKRQFEFSLQNQQKAIEQCQQKST